jgi:predicted MFS family arabinose efflux permease
VTSAGRTAGVTLALCLAASQAALLVLTPILVSVAGELDVSTATAGQLRTVSGLAAGVTALLAGLLASRFGLRDLLAAGLLFLTAGSAVSAASPVFAVLALAQVLIGIGAGLSYSAAVAAAAEWASPEGRSRVLAAALLGPPLAWVIGMPVAGIVGDVSWRLAWVAVPLLSALLALGVLLRRPATPPAPRRAGLRAVFAQPGVIGWSVGELFAYSAWVGTLLFVGALFEESYGLSVTATGLALGLGALIYIPGNLLFRRWVDDYPRVLLIGLALAAAGAVAVLGAIRPNAWISLVVFSALSFIAGGRTLAGSARGLDLGQELRLGVTGVRTAALQLGAFVGAGVGGIALAAGGFTALGLTFAALFVCATIPHVCSARACRPVDSPTLAA